MSKSTPLMILTAAALFSGIAGTATRTYAAPKPAAKIAQPTAKPMPMPMTRPMTAAPRPAAPAPRAAPARPAMKTAARPAGTGRMVQAKLSNGKTITYNCSLAGNATKKACR